MDMSGPDITVTQKAVGSVGAYLSRGGGRSGDFVIVPLDWNQGIPTTSAVRYAILDEDGHVIGVPRRRVPA